MKVRSALLVSTAFLAGLTLGLIVAPSAPEQALVATSAAGSLPANAGSTSSVSTRDRSAHDGETGNIEYAEAQRDGVVVQRRESGGTTTRAAEAETSCRERAATAEARAARLERDVASARADLAERDGERIDLPSSLPPHFEPTAVRAAVTEAFRQTRVEGALEDLDCTEFPCIAFGRLRGDEEHMERVERARAFHPYRDDVLTLLFWATSDESAPRDAPRETGLFALAFYGRADRERHGAGIDQRIRGRVVDLWNTIRPGTSEPTTAP